MVVDEEQRFGVEHKETLKALRTNVDVLCDERDAHPAHARDGGDRHPRDVDAGHPARGAAPGAHVRRRVRREADHRRDPARAAARGPGVLRAQQGRLDRAHGVAAHGAGARGPRRRGARQDERAPARAGHRRLLGEAVRRAGLHDDRRDRPGHLQRQHPDPRARRPARPVAAAPAARARGPRARAGVLLLPVPAREAAHRDGARPAADDRREHRPRRRHGRRDEGPRDPRRRQPAGRRAVGAHRGRRLRPLHPHGGRGGGQLPRATSRRRSPTSPSSCPSTRTSRTTTSRTSGCGSRRTARSRRRSTRRRSARSAPSSSTGTGRCPPPSTTCSRSPSSGMHVRGAGLSDVTAQGKFVRFAPVELPESAQLRLKRLYPGAVLKPAVRTVLVPWPDDGADRRQAACRAARCMLWAGSSSTRSCGATCRRPRRRSGDSGLTRRRGPTMAPIDERRRGRSLVTVHGVDAIGARLPVALASGATLAACTGQPGAAAVVDGTAIPASDVQTALAELGAVLPGRDAHERARRSSCRSRRSSTLAAEQGRGGLRRGRPGAARLGGAAERAQGATRRSPTPSLAVARYSSRTPTCRACRRQDVGTEIDKRLRELDVEVEPAVRHARRGQPGGRPDAAAVDRQGERRRRAPRTPARPCRSPTPSAS